MNTDAIRDFTLEAREILIGEVEDQLEGIYGLLGDGHFEPVGNYPALAQIPECAETRSRLETFIADEQAAGLQPKAARRKLAREAAFTWLNRLVAFKMMETRRLVRQTVTRGADSNGFKMWLTEEGNEQHLADYEAGEMPKDARGEGPRDRAYRRFLLAQCTRLAEEIRVLFDPDNLVSRLTPRPSILGQLMDLISDGELDEAWEPGNEETIGWVYQGFNAEELEAAFREARLSKKKFEAEDIPAVTQLFTPRWIVRFLVENTLGRTWVQMHPDSALAEKLEYLVPLEGDIPPVPLKPVREVTLLDPACGTMHFGLVAFDLYVEMYREELARAGREGWPQKPSVEREDEIAATIVANNLHGIDIDLRAVQLSALTLYLKAKTRNPKSKLTESRLACADIHVLDGNRLEAFLNEAGVEQPIYRRIVAALQNRLKDAEQLGSLLRLDEEIRALVEEERRRYQREGQQMDLFGWSAEQFGTDAGRAEFWDTLEIQIGQALDAFAKQQAEQGRDPSLFVGETTKGLRLLEVMGRRYDAVVTNPPYMSARKMNARLKSLVAEGYKPGKGDLYAAFIQRCVEFAADQGRVGMLTMHSFMFISSYQTQRTWIRDRVAIETVAHAGPSLFDVGNPGTLQTVAHVLRREGRQEVRDDAVGTYFRLVKEPDAEAKRARFESELRNMNEERGTRGNDEVGTMNDEPDPLHRSSFIIHRYKQSDFDAIPGSPWVYWITPGLRRIFQTLPKLGEIAQPRVGLQTGDNFRFLRFWWEVGTGRIGFGCRNAAEAQASGRRWFPYMKGGSFRRWYGNQEYVLNWQSDGYELKAFEPCVIRNPDYYFRRGVTWSRTTSKHLSVRVIPSGHVFDCEAACAFCSEPHELLGLLNGTAPAHLLGFINPTIHYQIGDLARLPVPTESSQRLRESVDRAIELAKADSREDETTWDFVAPAPWNDEGGRDGNEERGTMNDEGGTMNDERKGLAEDRSSFIVHRSSFSSPSSFRRSAALADIERQIDEEVYRLYGISDEDRRAIEAELRNDEVGTMNDEEKDSAGGG